MLDFNTKEYLYLLLNDNFSYFESNPVIFDAIHHNCPFIGISPLIQEKELEGLINEYIRESILYREAIKLKLDKDDVIIRRRLAQKLEFITNDLIQAPEPTDEEIIVYFKNNKDKYKTPDLITLTHIYFDPDKIEKMLQQ